MKTFDELFDSPMAPDMNEVYEAGIALEKERDELAERIEVMEEDAAIFNNPADAWAHAEALEEECKALRVYVERLREAYYENKWIDDRDYAVLGALNETPAQSLAHIKAQVEEETIERCADIAFESDGWAMAVGNIGNMPRKYANQPEAGTLPAAKGGE